MAGARHWPKLSFAVTLMVLISIFTGKAVQQ